MRSSAKCSIYAAIGASFMGKKKNCKKKCKKNCKKNCIVRCHRLAAVTATNCNKVHHTLVQLTVTQ